VSSPQPSASGPGAATHWPGTAPLYGVGISEGYLPPVDSRCRIRHSCQARWAAAARQVTIPCCLAQCIGRVSGINMTKAGENFGIDRAESDTRVLASSLRRLGGRGLVAYGPGSRQLRSALIPFGMVSYVRTHRFRLTYNLIPLLLSTMQRTYI
jgi:hypothetical protein